LYRLFSKRRLGIGGPAGAMRAYEVGACSAAEQTNGGIQAGAFLVRRCGLVAGEEYLCKLVIAYGEAVPAEP